MVGGIGRCQVTDTFERFSDAVLGLGLNTILYNSCSCNASRSSSRLFGAGKHGHLRDNDHRLVNIDAIVRLIDSVALGCLLSLFVGKRDIFLLLDAFLAMAILITIKWRSLRLLWRVIGWITAASIVARRDIQFVVIRRVNPVLL